MGKKKRAKRKAKGPEEKQEPQRDGLWDLYRSAVQLYRAKDVKEAFAKFTDVKNSVVYWPLHCRGYVYLACAACCARNNEYQLCSEWTEQSLSLCGGSWQAWSLHAIAISVLCPPLAASACRSARNILISQQCPPERLSRLLDLLAEISAPSPSVLPLLEAHTHLLDEMDSDLFLSNEPRVVPEATQSTDSINTDGMPLLLLSGDSIGGLDSAFLPYSSTELLDPSLFHTPMMAKQLEIAKHKASKAFKDQQFTESLLQYSRAIYLSPDSTLFSNRACVYAWKEWHYATIADCTASLQRGPTLKAYARRANARKMIGQLILAYKDYQSATECTSAKDGVAAHLSCLEELSDIYKTIINSLPDNVTDAQLVGLKVMMQKNDEAIQKLRSLADANKAPAKKKQRKKLTEEQKELLWKKIRHYSAELEESPINSDARCHRAYAFYQLGELDNAMADCKLGLRYDQDHQKLLKIYKLVKKHLTT